MQYTRNCSIVGGKYCTRNCSKVGVLSLVYVGMYKDWSRWDTVYVQGTVLSAWNVQETGLGARGL